MDAGRDILFPNFQQLSEFLAVLPGTSVSALALVAQSTNDVPEYVEFVATTAGAYLPDRD